MTKILIVEDEASFSEALEFLLGKEGFSVVTAANGKEAMTKFDQGGIDLVLLDLMIPEVSGTDVCKYIRSKAATPIIMLTAKDSEIDKVVGLELGADDYVTKPYSSRELVARIKAVLRRNGSVTNDSGMLHVGSISMDVDRHLVTINKKPVALPLKEFELLEFLMRNAGRVLTRIQLIDRVWGSEIGRAHV